MLEYEYISLGTIIPLPQAIKKTICPTQTTENQSNVLEIGI